MAISSKIISIILNIEHVFLISLFMGIYMCTKVKLGNGYFNKSDLYKRIIQTIPINDSHPSNTVNIIWYSFILFIVCFNQIYLKIDSLAGENLRTL